MKYALITGSAGLIGSESVRFFIDKGYKVVGVDNDMRQYFFGKEASTDWNRKALQKKFGKIYIHVNTDVRDNDKIKKIKNKKIKIHRQENNNGVLAAKIGAVSLCKNEWVILLDSDNTICKSYLDAIYKVNEWNKKIIYCPSFVYPLLNFNDISGQTLDFKKTKDLLIKKTSLAEKFLNDGNFFFNKNYFMNIFNKYKFFKAQA